MGTFGHFNSHERAMKKRNLKALLIYPKPEVIKRFRFGYSLGLLRIGALLKLYGIDARYLDFGLETIEKDKLLSIIAPSEIIIFEFDSFALRRSINYKHGEFLIRMIREKFPKKTIIVCGNDIVLVPRNVPGADITIKKDCFMALDDINNIIIDKFDLKELPPTKYLELLPDRSLLAPEFEYGKNIIHSLTLAKSAITRTGFGCKGTCSFCQRKGYFPKPFLLNLEYVKKEFIYFFQNKYKNIWIEDDNFTSNLESKSILNIIQELKGKTHIKIFLSSWTRIDFDLLFLMKSAGVSIISFGIESVVRDIQKFYRKIIDLNKVRKIVQICDDIGIFTVGNFIIGAPMESDYSIRKLKEIIFSTPFDDINIKILDYMVGSSLFKSLPEHLKKKALPDRHIFADKRYGLTTYYYEDLKHIAREIKTEYSRHIKNKLEWKVRKYGFPYYGR